MSDKSALEEAALAGAAAAEDEAKEAAVEAVNELVGDGLSGEEALDLVIGILDAALAFKLFLPGVAGDVAEEVSDELLAQAREKILTFQRDADKIDERAQRAEDRGHHKVAARRRKRAERVRARQAE